MVTTLTPSPILRPDASGIVLQGISWNTYQSLVKELEGQPGQRLTYDDGSLEIFMPLPPHEVYKRRLGRLVEIVTEERGIEIYSLGTSTWSRKDLAKGIEADECYYIQNEAIFRGKLVIDLTIDPPPDLAIEVDVTSPSLPRLPIYAALEIPEVWQFDSSPLTLLQLREDKYVAISHSLALPMLSQDIIQHWLEQAKNRGETAWAKALRSWARHPH